jgi:4-diphosphocytidyl-2-C-methyl-D-erythritol kinase
MSVTVFSPAKINLFLAVTGRRPDGYHDLVSVVAPLDFGDHLTAEVRPGGGDGDPFTLECADPAVPTDGSNLILKAAEAFAAATGWRGRVRFRLEKRIPVGAGLGGGSSNAVAALRALNALAGGIAGDALLASMAAALGSDCALFLANVPVVMRGRGERIERLADAAAGRLAGRRVVLFKPGFGIGTAWAYRRMAALAGSPGPVYLAEAEAERRVADWTTGDAPVEAILGNNFEPVVFAKYVALPVLLEKLRRETGAAVQMSGSGSACFALPRDESVTEKIAAGVRSCWGPDAFVQLARLGAPRPPAPDG